MRQAGADATRLNALRTCIRDFQCAAARGSESRSDRCWVAAENGATTFMGLLCPGRGRPPSEDNVPRIHFCGPEAGRVPQRRGQTGSTADHRTTQQRPIAMKCAASLGALGLVLVHWLPAVTAWPPPPADFWAAYRRFYPVDGGAPWTAQSSPTSVVFPTQRYAPDRKHLPKAVLQGCEPQVLFNERIKCLRATGRLLMAYTDSAATTVKFLQRHFTETGKRQTEGSTDGHTGAIGLPQKL
ncbi:uncharacterized protein LOC119176971 isoform X2 [Rhipicephalus microplus]|uniref:uncharacterized protein LOC119176971 isoform X2 n=1 Tax=Rhipicephalus microplus TaxID=6941 RepID=UPI003F6BF11E